SASVRASRSCWRTWRRSPLRLRRSDGESRTGYAVTMSDVTQLLDAAHRGDKQAAAELLPHVYDELRRLASAKIAGEKPGHTLAATARVHEAHLRLTGGRSFESRSHFLRAAAEAMRHILVDHARARNSAKRGGGRRIELELEHLAISPVADELEALDE